MFRYSVKRKFVMMTGSSGVGDSGGSSGSSDDMAGAGQEYFKKMKELTLQKMEYDYNGAVITTYAGIPEKIRPPQ